MTQSDGNIYHVHRFSAIPIKIPREFFSELKQIILKFMWKHKRLWIVKTILRKKNRNGWMLPVIRPQYKATIIKTIWYCTKNRHGSMKEDREPKKKSMHLQSINIQLRKQESAMELDHSLFNKWCWKIWTATCQIIKLEHFSYHKKKLKMD